MWSFAAISAIGWLVALRAISISLMGI